MIVAFLVMLTEFLLEDQEETRPCPGTSGENPELPGRAQQLE
jgi:hypothetical protein